MTKPSTRTYNPEKTRAAIIAAALKLFESPGYHGASVGDIAKEAAITKGAFYHHFASKEELLQLIHDEFFAYQLEQIESALLRSDRPREQLRSLIRCMVEGVLTYRSHVTVFFQERRHLSKQRHAKISKKRKVMAGTLIEVLQRGMASGDFRKDLDAKVTALGIIGMCAWTYQWFASGGRLTGDDVSEQFCNIVLKGVEA